MKRAGELRLPRREGIKAEEALRGSVPCERANPTVRETSENDQVLPVGPEGAAVSGGFIFAHQNDGSYGQLLEGHVPEALIEGEAVLQCLE